MRETKMKTTKVVLNFTVPDNCPDHVLFKCINAEVDNFDYDQIAECISDEIDEPCKVEPPSISIE